MQNTLLAHEHDGYIILHIKIYQDPTKQTNLRTSTQILDFMGDVGGFEGSLLLITVVFGQYFSEKLFMVKVAKDMYIGKKRA